MRVFLKPALTRMKLNKGGFLHLLLYCTAVGRPGRAGEGAGRPALAPLVIRTDCHRRYLMLRAGSE